MIVAEQSQRFKVELAGALEHIRGFGETFIFIECCGVHDLDFRVFGELYRERTAEFAQLGRPISRGHHGRQIGDRRGGVRGCCSIARENSATSARLVPAKPGNAAAPEVHVCPRRDPFNLPQPLFGLVKPSLHLAGRALGRSLRGRR